MKTKLIIPFMFMLIFLFNSCATRGIHDQYFGATEQRLVTHSIDKLVKSLPEKDFMPLKGQAIYLECYFVEKNEPLNFARKRLEMELKEKYSCTLSDIPESAQFIVHFFFNAIGTDQDILGFRTPEVIIPSVGLTSISILSFEMYHGVSELYYYIIDKRKPAIMRGEILKAIIRTDRLVLPIISIPLNTLD